MAFECPHCGQPLDPRAAFCRECGSDGQTGWRDDVEETSLELPEDMDDADYADFLAREFPQEPPSRRTPTTTIRLVAFVLLLAFLSFFLRLIAKV